MFTNVKIAGIGVSPDKYHQQESARGTAEHAMSSSSLREFGHCPSRYISGYESPDTASKEWGSLLDCLALTPSEFPKRYAVQPGEYRNDDGDIKDWNNNAKVCKAWRKQQEGLSIIHADLKTDASCAVERLRKDETIASFLDASDCQVHLVGQWKDKESGLVIPVQALLDIVPRKISEFSKSLADLKTTRNAGVMPWQRWCYQAGYHIQAAFNLDLYVAATQEDRCQFCFILQENFAPWETGKRLLSQDFLDLGRAEYKRLLANYCWCLKHNHWPGYDEHDEAVQNWSIVSPEPWMADAGQFAPKFIAPEETEEENNDVPMP